MKKGDAPQLTDGPKDDPAGHGYFAVTVEDIGLKRRNPARDAMQRVDVARIELARDGDALEAERQAGLKLGKNGFGARAPRRAVDEQTNSMAALGLALHQIDHMPK